MDAPTSLIQMSPVLRELICMICSAVFITRMDLCGHHSADTEQFHYKELSSYSHVTNFFKILS